MTRQRRQILQAVSGIGLAGMAGCASLFSGGNNTNEEQSENDNIGTTPTSEQGVTTENPPETTENTSETTENTSETTKDTSETTESSAETTTSSTGVFQGFESSPWFEYENGAVNVNQQSTEPVFAGDQACQIMAPRGNGVGKVETQKADYSSFTTSFQWLYNLSEEGSHNMSIHAWSSGGASEDEAYNLIMLSQLGTNFEMFVRERSTGDDLTPKQSVGSLAKNEWYAFTLEVSSQDPSIAVTIDDSTGQQVFTNVFNLGSVNRTTGHIQYTTFLDTVAVGSHYFDNITIDSRQR